MRAITIAIALCACSGGSSTSSQNPDAAPGTGGDSDAPPFANNTGPYFTTKMFWNRDVSGVAKSSKSDAIIGALRAAGGWGNGDTFQIDFALDVLSADSSTPMRSFTPTGDFYSP